MVAGTMPRRLSDDVTKERQAAELLLLSEGARAVGILTPITPVLVVKGASLAELVWQPGERNMTDVDLLLEGSRLNDARRALANAGWTLLAAPRRPVSSLVHRAFSARSPRGSLVDVHAHVAQRLRWPVPVRELLARAVPFRLAGRPAMRPALEDAVLIAAINDAKDELALGGSSIADIARLTALGTLEWASIVERARRYRATVATWLALTRARTQFGAAVPRDVLDELRPRRASALEALVGPVGASRARFADSRRIRQAVVGPLLTDSAPRFVASAVAWAAVRVADLVVTGVGSGERTPSARDATDGAPAAGGRR